MIRVTLRYLVALSLVLTSTVTTSGVIDPDCTATKAAKSAAMKATVGVSGRCSVAEAVTDTSKRAVGIEEKGVIEKHTDKHDDDGLAVKGAKAAKHAVAD